MKKFSYKIAAASASALLMMTTVCAPIGQVFASSTITTNTKGNIGLADGTYSVKLSILKENEDSASSAASYFLNKDDAKLVVSNGVGKVTLTYTNSMIGTLHQQFGTEKEILAVTEKDGKKHVELTVYNLDEPCELGIEVNTPFMTMNHIVRVFLGDLPANDDQVTQTPTPEKGSIELADGTYTVDYSILNESKDEASNASGYFGTKAAVFTVKDKKATLRLTYSDSMIGNLHQVFGTEKEALKVTESGSSKYVEMSFSSLDETGYLYMEIDTKTTFGVMKHTVRIVLDKNSIKKDGGSVTPDATTSPSISVTPSPTVKPSQETTVNFEDGIYETKAYLWHATSDQASMAASAMEEKVRFEVKNGKARMYIYTKKMSLGTITAYLQELKVASADGTYKSAKVERYDSSNNPICFSFEVPAYTQYIDVKVNPRVALMGNQDISARLKVNFTSAKKVTGTVDLTKYTNAASTATKAPTATTKPAVTKAPVATKAPVVTKAPVATKKPAATKAPTIVQTVTTQNTTGNQAETVINTTAEETEEQPTETPAVEPTTTPEAVQEAVQEAENDVQTETTAPTATIKPVATTKKGTETPLMIATAAAVSMLGGTAVVTFRKRLRFKGKDTK